MDESVLRKKIESIGLAKTLESMHADDLTGNCGVLLSYGATLDDLSNKFWWGYFDCYKELIEQGVPKDELNKSILGELDEFYGKVEVDDIERLIKNGMDAGLLYDFIMSKGLNMDMIASFVDFVFMLHDNGVTAEQIKGLMKQVLSSGGAYTYPDVRRLFYRPVCVPYDIFERFDDFAKIGIDCSEYLSLNIDWIVYDNDGYDGHDLRYEIEKLPEYLRKEAINLAIDKADAYILDLFDARIGGESLGFGHEDDLVDFLEEYIDLKDFAKKIDEVAKTDEDCRYIYFLAYKLFKKDRSVMEAKTVVKYLMRAFKDDEDSREEYYGWLKEDNVDEDIIKCLIE